MDRNNSQLMRKMIPLVESLLVSYLEKVREGSEYLLYEGSIEFEVEKKRRKTEKEKIKKHSIKRYIY